MVRKVSESAKASWNRKGDIFGALNTFVDVLSTLQVGKRHHRVQTLGVDGGWAVCAQDVSFSHFSFHL